MTNLNIEIIMKAIAKINKPDFDEDEFIIRRNVIKTIIDKIIWDGENAEIFFS
jgi:hypothetical protein